LKRLVFGGLALAFSATASVWAAGPGISDITVTPNHVVAKVDLPGNLKADLTLVFEQSVGLTADSIGISARIADPGDLSLTSRLPASVSIPIAFPVVITIEPPLNGPLSFSGAVAIDLHTHNLTYLPGTPLRFFVAPTGKGTFQDITASIGLGSYRTGANKGGFSEFMIVADLRPLNGVIDEKFKRLASALDANATRISPAAMLVLRGTLSEAKSAYYDANDAAGASDKIQSFADAVKQNSGSAIPDVWRASRDLVNAAGDLRSLASTLKFSLILKASGG